MEMSESRHHHQLQPRSNYSTLLMSNGNGKLQARRSGSLKIGVIQ
jgi:hypothetical protein